MYGKKFQNFHFLEFCYQTFISSKNSFSWLQNRSAWCIWIVFTEVMDAQSSFFLIQTSTTKWGLCIWSWGALWGFCMFCHPSLKNKIAKYYPTGFSVTNPCGGSIKGGSSLKQVSYGSGSFSWTRAQIRAILGDSKCPSQYLTWSWWKGI